MNNIDEFLERAEEIKKISLSFTNPLLVHHYDADGISAASVVVKAFLDKGRKIRRMFLKKLDDQGIELLEKEKEIIFVDLGGGNPRVNELKDVVIIDHHQTEGITQPQINPLLFGFDGGKELSSSTTAYFVFRVLVDVAIVGAVGDMQYPLEGLNRRVLEEGISEKKISLQRDLIFYGKYSRPLVQFLEYSDSPYVPGLSFNHEGAVSLLSRLGIPLKEGDRWRTYSDLNKREKTLLVSALASRLLDTRGLKATKELIGENYILLTRDPSSYMYEAKEFSTLLNACGRHGHADLGVEIALGDRNAYEKGKSLLEKHRRLLREGIEFAQRKVTDFGLFYLLDGRGVIDEGIIGIVCGMYLPPWSDKPILGLSFGEEGWIKVSMRSTKKSRINCGLLMRKAAASVGGIGGGHARAAGANIPKDKLNEFFMAIKENWGQLTKSTS